MRRVGFTIVELMVSVGIVATLAALGIALLHEAAAKTKFGEVYPTSEAMIDAMIAYLSAADIPDTAPDGTWPAGAAGPVDGIGTSPSAVAYADAPSQAAFAAIGFTFEGEIRGQYTFNARGSGTPMCLSTPRGSGKTGWPVTVMAWSDADADGKIALSWGCEHGHAVGTLYKYNQKGRMGQQMPTNVRGKY